MRYNLPTLALLALGGLAWASPASAQGISPNPQAQVPTATGAITGVANFSWNGTAWVAAGGATAQGGSAATPTYTAQSPAARTLVPLDVATVTTGGTAVTALTAGHRTAGGFIVSSNAAGICVSQLGVAGTATAGSTVCVAQNQLYTLVPNAGAVSVNSTASGVALGGEGLN